MNRQSDFAAACYDQNSLDELREALAQPEADATDCETWGLNADEWRAAIRTALAEREIADALDEREA